MTVLSKTLTDYQAALGYGIGPGGVQATKTYSMVYQQIDVPSAKLYCIVSALSDGHLEVWAVSA